MEQNGTILDNTRPILIGYSVKSSGSHSFTAFYRGGEHIFIFAQDRVSSSMVPCAKEVNEKNVSENMWLNETKENIEERKSYGRTGWKDIRNDLRGKIICLFLTCTFFDRLLTQHSLAFYYVSFFFSPSFLLSFDGARENSTSKIITLAYDLMQFIQRGTVYRGTIKSRKQKTTGKMEERLQTVRWKMVNRSR